MREFFYAAMLTLSGAICGLLLFTTAPGVHRASAVEASPAREVPALSERGGSVPLLGGR